MKGIESQREVQNTQDRQEKKRDRRPLWAAFWVTVIYAGFACLQLLVMGITLNMDQRPWIGVVGNGGISLTLVKDQPLEISGIAQNFGRGPALDVVTVNRMQIVPQGQHPTFNSYSKSDADTPAVLFPGSTVTLNAGTRYENPENPRLLNESDIVKIRDQQVRIYFFGSIWYKDSSHIPFSREHRTDYCFTYRPELGAPSVAPFDACNEHNYAD